MPQIEIMQSDLPHTLYDFKKKNRPSKKEDKPFVFNPEDRAIKLQQEAYERALAKVKARREGNYKSVKDLFNR